MCCKPEAAIMLLATFISISKLNKIEKTALSKNE